MHIDQANIFNLTGLWNKYGSWLASGEKLPLIHINCKWPHRGWIDWSRLSVNQFQQVLSEINNNNSWSDIFPKSVVFPVWPIMTTIENCFYEQCESQLIEQRLLENNWVCTFEQTAMYIKLDKKEKYVALPNAGLEVSLVYSSEDITEWLNIGSEAFGYIIDRSVIESLLDDKNIQILIAYQDGHAVASALLYKTNRIIGLHQVAVKNSQQGKGIAKHFMQEIISASAYLWQGDYIVLQASEAGQPLYEKLGFIEQFKIKNYQRIESEQLAQSGQG